MSDYGLIISNNNSKIQIDSTYKNFTLFEKHNNTFNFATGGLTAAISSGDQLDYETENIMAAFRPVSTDFVAGPIFNHAANDDPPPDFLWTNASFITDINAIGSTTFYWVVFREGQTLAAPSVDFGLIVRNASNQVVFHSNDQYFRILAVHTGNLTKGESPDTVSVISAANNYFMLLPVFSQYIDCDAGWCTKYCRGLKYKDSTHLYVGSFELDSFASGNPSDDAWQDAYSIIELGVI